MLMFVVICFALSSMFSYSYYGTSCAAYLFGERKARYYTYAFLASSVVFAVVPLEAAVGMCDLFYAMMALPTMFTLLALSRRVHRVTRRWFKRTKSNDAPSVEMATTPEDKDMTSEYKGAEAES